MRVMEHLGEFGIKVNGQVTYDREGVARAWLGIPPEPHPSLGDPESEFPLPILEFR